MTNCLNIITVNIVEQEWVVNDMREILFKAKTEKIVRTYNNGLDDGVWVQGYLRCDCGMWLIYQFEYDRADQVAYEVNPETICQFTGRYDVNKKRIWENDIVKNIIDGDIYKCAWNSYNCEYELRNEKESFGLGYINPHSYEVVGNAIDNPELLKGGVE